MRRPVQGIVERSPFWHPGLAHPVIDALALSQIDRIIAKRAGTVTSRREVWVKRKACLYRGPRFF
jgi:hypothetical protein